MPETEIEKLLRKQAASVITKAVAGVDAAEAEAEAEAEACPPAGRADGNDDESL